MVNSIFVSPISAGLFQPKEITVHKAERHNQIFKVNYYSKDYLEVPLVYRTNNF